MQTQPLPDPCLGYYEWHTVGKEKQPYYFTPRNGSVLTFAGLWEEWRGRVNNETLTSCTMLITKTNTFISAVHDRMPVILKPEKVRAWLTGSAGTQRRNPSPEAD